MADGGIHDQLGGGFCRYSVDAEWSIPHFEKMLYDNGPLLGLYADLARITGEPQWATVARGIVGWLTREMRAPDGAFYSSLDADSDGEEGKFYVWSADDVRALLPADEYAVVAPHFGLDGPPNFEGHAWNLRVMVPLPEVAARLAIEVAQAQARLDAARATLLAARARRVRPGTDDKILTSWNALAIAGLARAARAQDEPAFADLAVAAADALRATAWRNGRLLATRKGDRAHLNAYLDDYAFLLCRADRVDADPLPAAGFRLGAGARDGAARLVRGSRTRRLLLHEPRSRGAHPSPEAGSRQRHTLGQRGRRAGADRAGAPLCRAAPRRGGPAHGAVVRGVARRVAGRLFDAAVRASRTCSPRPRRCSSPAIRPSAGPGSARWKRTTARRRGCSIWQGTRSFPLRW